MKAHLYGISLPVCPVDDCHWPLHYNWVGFWTCNLHPGYKYNVMTLEEIT